MGETIIRKYTDRDKNDLISLYRQALTKDYSETWFDWLYNNDVLQDTQILLVEHDNAIVGAISEIRKTIMYKGKAFICGRHLDPVVDPSMRGKSLFSKLLKSIHDLTSQYVDFYYCFPNAKSLPGFLKNGYTSVGPLYAPSHQAKFIGASPKDKIRFFLTGIKNVGGSNRSVERISSEELQSLSFTPPNDRYTLDRSSVYLNWRYVLCPIRKYELLGQRKNGLITALCIIRDLGQGKIAILDFIVFSRDYSLRDFLIFMRDDYEASKITTWDANVDQISSYFYGKNEHNFLVREGKSTMEESFFKLNKWFLSAGEVESN